MSLWNRCVSWRLPTLAARTTVARGVGHALQPAADGRAWRSMHCISVDISIGMMAQCSFICMTGVASNRVYVCYATTSVLFLFYLTRKNKMESSNWLYGCIFFP